MVNKKIGLIVAIIVAIASLITIYNAISLREGSNAIDG